MPGWYCAPRPSASFIDAVLRLRLLDPILDGFSRNESRRLAAPGYLSSAQAVF